MAELSELLVQVFVSPVHTESLYKDVGLGLAVPQEVLVVGERAAGLTVQLWELDVVEETSGLDDVGEAAEGVVEVLEGWPLQHDLTVADLLLEELVKFNEGEFLGQVSDEDSLGGACDHAAGGLVLLESLGELGLLDQ